MKIKNRPIVLLKSKSQWVTYSGDPLHDKVRIISAAVNSKRKILSRAEIAKTILIVEEE
ncbi:hypothetical protein HJ020_23970 [Vibrio parahaemolyticus]|nr:hypothetical protein [Vibrio parahaemolyticus]